MQRPHRCTAQLRATRVCCQRPRTRSLSTCVLVPAPRWKNPYPTLARSGAPVPVAVQVAQRHAQHARVQRGRAQRRARRQLKVQRLGPQRVRQEVGAAQRQAALKDPAARAAALRLVGPGRAGNSLSGEAGKLGALPCARRARAGEAVLHSDPCAAGAPARVSAQGTCGLATRGTPGKQAAEELAALRKCETCSPAQCGSEGAGVLAEHSACRLTSAKAGSRCGGRSRAETDCAQQASAARAPAHFVGGRAGGLAARGVVPPQVNRAADRRHAALKHGRGGLRRAVALLGVGVLLPVAVAQRVLGQEAIVDRAQLRDVALRSRGA